MSAEDAILYRRIGDEWRVIVYGFTFDDAESNDREFLENSLLFDEDTLLKKLDILNKHITTEHGICYSPGEQTHIPKLVPQEHRSLCYNENGPIPTEE